MGGANECSHSCTHGWPDSRSNCCANSCSNSGANSCTHSCTHGWPDSRSNCCANSCSNSGANSCTHSCTNCCANSCANSGANSCPNCCANSCANSCTHATTCSQAVDWPGECGLAGDIEGNITAALDGSGISVSGFTVVATEVSPTPSPPSPFLSTSSPEESAAWISRLDLCSAAILVLFGLGRQ